MLKLALRAASLLPVWDGRAPRPARISMPVRRPSRFRVVDPEEPGSEPLPGGQGGRLLVSYQTRELAVAFAVDHCEHGGSVVVVDSQDGAEIFSSVWSGELMSRPPPPHTGRRRRR